MTTFVTGGTGYLGSYALSRLIEQHREPVVLLVRATSRRQAVQKLWGGLQLHMDADEFQRALDRVDFVSGDLTAPELGLGETARQRVAESCSSVLHIAASLNRKSEKSCLNSNLRGTLSVIKLARFIAERNGGLRRFTHVSTTAVCGQRHREIVHEDHAIEWDRSDYDPYGRTKKFCEHMVRELLPDVPKLFLRPSTVMGDSRHPRTTQFDMVRAFCVLADMPFLPMRGESRIDIVNADFVGRAIADLHLAAALRYDTYHLASGAQSKTAAEIATALVAGDPRRRPPRFVPSLERPFDGLMNRLSNLPKSQAAYIGSLFKVFLPYITFDTVFDNERVCTELVDTPAPFTDYCADLYSWANLVKFQFPRAELPAHVERAMARAERRDAPWT